MNFAELFPRINPLIALCTFLVSIIVQTLIACAVRFIIVRKPMELKPARIFTLVMGAFVLLMGFLCGKLLNMIANQCAVIYASVLWVEICNLIVRYDGRKLLTKELWKRIFTIEMLQNFFAMALGLFSLYTAYFGVLIDTMQRSIHLALALPVLFLGSMVGKKAKNSNKFEKITAIPLALFSLVVFLYTGLNANKLAGNFGNLSTIEFITGIVAILVMLEASRRTTGIVVPIVSLIFLAYALYGRYIPFAGLSHRGYSLSRIVSHLYVGTAGIFSTPLGATATILSVFLIFGAFLEETKGSKFFMDASFALTGRMTGGPAKAAVVSSCLMGMVSGSANANVASTGIFTIPLMKKSGYRNHIAGAVEAVASTGSQIMPPVMGTTAFIIAETLDVTYATVCAAALIPALLYFISVYMMVHLEACKYNLRAGIDMVLPDMKKTLIEYGHSILPLIILIVMIVQGRGASYTAMKAILAAVVISWVRSYTRIGFIGCCKALVKACKGIVSISAVCACAGIITGMVSLTGLGLKMSSLIIAMSHGNLLVALLITAVVLTILGMGLPTAPAYLLVATLVCPALIKMGVNELAAHFFVFYGAIRSGITPPVCTVAYTAAGIADAEPNKVGLTALRLGIVCVLVPFFFVYEPALLGQGATLSVVQALVTGIIGCWALSIGSEGYCFGKLNKLLSAVAFIAGLVCIYPGTLSDIIGVAVTAAITLYSYFSAKRSGADKVTA